MNELDEGQIGRMRKMVADADVLRDMMKHPGMEMVREIVDNLTGRLHDKWLLVDEEEAKKIRMDARGYELFFSLVKQRIIAGDEARKHLKGNE